MLRNDVKISDSISQDILLQICDVNQSDVALYSQVHQNGKLFTFNIILLLKIVITLLTQPQLIMYKILLLK